MDEYRLSIGLNDTLSALAIRVLRDGIPRDLRTCTATFSATNAITAANVVTETATGVDVEPEVDVTVDITTGEAIAYDHGLKDGDVIRFEATSLPTGLSASLFYRVLQAWATGFSIADGKGKQVKPSTAGTSVQVVPVGRITYAWQSADVGTARTLDCIFRVVSGGAKDSYPTSKKLLVEIS